MRAMSPHAVPTRHKSLCRCFCAGQAPPRLPRVGWNVILADKAFVAFHPLNRMGKTIFVQVFAANNNEQAEVGLLTSWTKSISRNSQARLDVVEMVSKHMPRQRTKQEGKTRHRCEVVRRRASTANCVPHVLVCIIVILTEIMSVVSFTFDIP